MQAKSIDLIKKFKLTNFQTEVKRAVDEYITEEMARSECTNYLHTEVIEQKSELLGAFNLSQAIEECTWDVNVSNYYTSNLFIHVYSMAMRPKPLAPHSRSKLCDCIVIV
jgi:hypothetical protein